MKNTAIDKIKEWNPFKIFWIGIITTMAISILIASLSKYLLTGRTDIPTIINAAITSGISAFIILLVFTLVIKRLKSTENTVSSQKDLLLQIFDTMSEGFMIFNRENILVEKNKIIDQYLLVKTDIKGKSIAWILSEICNDDIAEDFLKKIEKNKYFEIEYRSNSEFFGKRLYYIKGFTFGNRTNVFISDITRHRKIEEEARLLALFPRLNPYPVLRCSADGHIKMANEAMVQLFPEIIINSTHISSVLPQFKDFEFSKMIHKKKHVVLSKIGQKTYRFIAIGFPEMSFYQCYGADVTELLLAKEKAEQSDTLKDLFLSNISHEIRTPLNIILQNARLLYDEKLSSDDKQTLIDSIDNNTLSILQLFDRILQISLFEAGQIKPFITLFEPHTLLSGMHVQYEKHIKQKAKKPIKLDVNLPEEHKELKIYSDVKLLKLAFEQIIDNAIKFTSSGTISMGYEVKENTITIYIKDTGIGIKEADKEIVFEKFRQSDENTSRLYEGIGLGLPIAKAAIELLNGSIWCSSTESNKGTIFYLQIPFQAKSA